MSNTRPPDRAELLALLLVVALVFVGVALWNVRVHGDWTCMWSNCIRVKP